MELVRSSAAPWQDPAAYWGAFDRATADLDPPFGVISLAALAHNAYDLLDRADGMPIRVASKSVRVRAVLDAVLALPGYHGVLAYTLAEALWLAETIEDVVIGYPTTDRASIEKLAASPLLASRVTLMVDSVDHLDFIDSVLGSGHESIRVALELDASFHSKALGYIGVYRSPVRTVSDAIGVARAIVERPGFELVGMMSYEAQIAGVTNEPPGKPMLGRTVRWAQKHSYAELLERRVKVVAAVRELAELEFVNGGGTGSIERTAGDPAITEVAAGSGLFGPRLFDGYRHFSPAPAAGFALSVVRKPRPDMATLLGGGWIASGPTAPDRSPHLAWPAGLEYVPREGAGEVQTPLRGEAAARLKVGDRVWLRHTKAGEISEHLDDFAIIDGERIIETVPTYRGEGRLFL
jgi:D-serine deaminase-like pyridoxal phosphate-dependent protein